MWTGFERQSPGSALQRLKAGPSNGSMGHVSVGRMGHFYDGLYGSTYADPRMDSCRLIECDLPLTANRPLHVK